MVFADALLLLPALMSVAAVVSEGLLMMDWRMKSALLPRCFYDLLLQLLCMKLRITLLRSLLHKSLDLRPIVDPTWVGLTQATMAVCVADTMVR